MQNSLIALLIFTCCFSTVAKARPCYYSSSNSCWRVNNTTDLSATVHCQGYGEEKFLYKEGLGPNESYSVQFDMGYGDGMGFPAPGVHFPAPLLYQMAKKPF